MKAQTVYLNMRTSAGVETVDEFTQEENQEPRAFRAYVRDMVKEYHIAGMNVYASSRCARDWSNK